MREIKGQRSGSKRWEHENQHYHQDTSAPTRYRCTFHNTQWICLAEVHAHEDGSFHASGVHHHPPPTDYENSRILTEALKKRAMESDDPPGEVVKQIFREYGRISESMTRAAAIKCVSRERERWRNRIPYTMAELPTLLRTFFLAEAIYQDQISAQDGSIITIFASQAMIERLNDAAELHVDSTLKAVPIRPRAEQLFIISLRKMDIGIPAVYMLTSHRTSETYIAIWQYLLGRAPGLRNSLHTVVSDFELAIIASVPRAMPWVSVRGCWFHFIRAVSRKWKSLGLILAPDEILRLTWALPLAPTDRIEERVNVIEMQARLHRPEFPNLGAFVNYLRTWWLPRANIMSVRNSPVRTNNIVEAFNRRIVQYVGGPHPPLTRFVVKLSMIIDDIEAKWSRIALGTDLNQDRRARQVNDDRHIQEQQERLDNHSCTMLEFLRNAMVNRALLNDINVHIARPAMEEEDVGDHDNI